VIQCDQVAFDIIGDYGSHLTSILIQFPCQPPEVVGELIAAAGCFKALEVKTMTSEEKTNYWIIVGSPDNFAKTEQLGFKVQGIKSRHRKKAEQMKPGDKMIYYITGHKAFAAISTITSEYFESTEPIWKSKKKDQEDYPFRVETKSDLVLDEADWVDAEPLARQMEYASKWPAKNWTLAFQGNVHKVPEGDYDLVKGALESAPVAAG